jgi:hypothetical protein
MAFIGNTNTTQAFTPAVDFFSGNASTTAFTLSRPVASVAQVQAVISNVPQDPGSAYTVSGNTITFTSAPPSGTNNIYVYYTSPITQVIAPGQGTVTSNSFASGASEFAAGTVLLFQQTSAPTGWTKSTTHNDKALRVVSGSASSGGSVAFTTAFASQAVSGSVGTSGATTLTSGQIPNHYHQVFTTGFAGTLGIQVKSGSGDSNQYAYTDSPDVPQYSTPAGSGSGTFANNDNGGGGSHTHTGGTFTGTAINLAVQYVDVIIATKD